MKECPACRRCYPDHVNHCPNDGDATTHSIAGEPMLDGRYQLETRLGHGGMGVVFKARHIFLKTSHAIKVILPDLVGNDPMLVTRFRQEALAAAAIRHQNIISVTDFGVVRGTMPFLVMEFVEGRSLHDILAAEKSLPPARALELISAIGAGVAAAHRQNIVHRDLKPLNIMIQNGLPIAEGLKILDFGLAKIKSGELLGSFVQAKTSGLMGSPFYMAPEQWSDEEPDGKADIYSLGVIMYQMLGGDVPFKGTSIPSIMKKHLTLEPPTFSEMGVQIPAQIEAAVRHALEKEAADRPASVDVFVQELREAVGSATRALATTYEDPYSLDSATLVTSAAPPTIPPTSFQSLGGLSNSLEDYAHEQSAASMEAKRLRAQADLLEERARQAAEAQRREQERLDQEAKDRVAREELAREEEARLKAQAEAKQKADELAARQREEEDAARQREEEDAARQREEARRLADEESQRKADEETRRKAEAQAAKVQVEADERQRAETDAARLHEASERQRAETRTRGGVAEDDRSKSITGAQDSAPLLAVEEQEARERSEREKLVREDSKEREPIEPQSVAASIDDTLVVPLNLESTQDQRQGVVTQSMYGKDQVPPAQTPARASETMGGVAGRSVIGYEAVEVQGKKSNSFRIAAAIIGIVLLVGGGVGAYLKFRQSGGTVVTKPPVVANPSGRVRPRENRSQPPVVENYVSELISVPGGPFQMGRAGKLVQEGPPHQVQVGEFSMDKTEVTNGEYAEFVAATERTPPSNWAGKKPVEGQERWPVTDVSLADANAFAEWRSKRDGVKYRLPTEEEWEYAARGGDEGNLYPWGNTWASGRAAIKDAGFASVQPVGSFPEGKAKWGHLDMIGNVWEWTSSTASYYPGSKLTIIPAHRTWAIIRGGSLASDSRGNKPISNTYRDWIVPTTKNDLLGFRLVREP